MKGNYHLAVECPDCHAKVPLMARNKVAGQEAWKCEGCNRVIQESEFKALGRIKADK